MRYHIVCSIASLVFTILQVSALAPEFTDLPADEVTVAGKTHKIPCHAFGTPKPHIKWIKNGRELTGRKYTTLESGDLEIKRVNFLDEGSYTCHVSNKFGSIEASAVLTVKQRTIIIDKPEDYEIVAGSTATFSCNAIADPSLSLTIDWLCRGESIHFEFEPRFVRGTDYSLRITKTTGQDSGTYTCVARTELDETKAEATLIVQDVPNPPRLVEVTCLSNEASVRWAPMGDNRAPILRYTIQYNTSFTPDTWENIHGDVPVTDQIYHVPMTPWANYTFRVLAWNKIGASLPSSHSEVCTIQPDVPYKNPDNVKGKGTEPQNIVIRWTVMPQIEHNAPRFMYRVFYKQDIPSKDWTIEDISDWKQDTLQVDNQPTYQRYKIKVIAINEKGEARVPPNEVTGFSGEDVPLQAPTNFTIVELTGSTSAMFSWNLVSAESIRGNFEGYKIQTWTHKGGEAGMREIFVRENTTEAVVSKLVPYSRNYVRVLAYNGRYDGPASETLSFETPEGVPGSVQSLDAFPMGTSALYLVWKKPLEPNGNLTGYKIYYQVVDRTQLGLLLERHPYVGDPETTRVKLAGLEPNTNYRIHIRAMTSVGEGEEYFIEHSTHSAISIPPDVPNFYWERISTDNEMATIRITWLPNLSGNLGSHFFVKYRLKGERMSQETLSEFYEDSIEIQHLTRGQVYLIWLVAVDGEYLTESLPQEVDTSG